MVMKKIKVFAITIVTSIFMLRANTINSFVVLENLQFEKFGTLS